MKIPKIALLVALSLLICGCAPSSSVPPETGDVKINISAISDFHGAVDQSGYSVGLAKMASYLKAKKAEGNILINSGDMWQGSFISNYTKGTLITECFEDIGFDANIIGNHEFDWGAGIISQNEHAVNDTFLGANIYKYPQGENGWEKADLGGLYKIKTINEGQANEVKVGIIGVIGQKQLTSITSTLVADYVFLNPTSIVKEQATYLRNVEGCDVVVASYHAANASESDSSSISYDIVGGKNGTGHKYVDAVFMGHEHEVTNFSVNDVPFTEPGAYGQYVTEVSLNFNIETKKVTCDSSKNVKLATQNLSEDADVKAKIDATKVETNPIGTKVVGTLDANMDTDMMSKYYAKLATDKAEALGYSIDYCVFNSSRQPLYAGQFTYSDLFETHPFLNDLYVLRVNGSNLRTQIVTYNSPMYRSTNAALSSSSTVWYNVLVYNYNGLHMGISSSYEKYYNYFSSFVDSGVDPILLKEGQKNINVFDLAISSLETTPNIYKADYLTKYFDNSQVTNAF